MKNTLRVAAAVAAFAVGSAAFASSCPREMKAIDDALPRASLAADRMAEVRKLRAEGEDLHKAGKHAESMAALGRAKALLGLK